MSGLSLGGPAPDFTLRDQFGQDVTLSSYRGTQGRGAVLLPVRLLRRLHRRDGRHPRPAGRVPDLRHRGAGDLLRPGLRAARLRRPGRAQLPAALGLLAARRGEPGPTTSSTRRRAARAGRRTSSTRTAWSAGRCTTPMPEGRDLDEHLQQLHAPGLDRRTGPTPVDDLRPRWRQSLGGGLSNACPVEPLVTRDASGSTHFRVRSCPGPFSGRLRSRSLCGLRGRIAQR